jgi:hypothetical protein
MPGQSWKGQSALPVDALWAVGNKLLDMNYTYLGSRQREGREEAVIALEGEEREAGQRTPGCRLQGTAAIDLRTGQVAFVWATVDLDLGVLINGEACTALGSLEISLRRRQAEQPK